MIRRLICIAALLLLSRATAAQNATTLTWDFDAAFDQVQTFTQTVVLDGQAVPGKPTCSALSTSKTTCSLSIVPLTTGSHTLSIEAVLNASSAKTIFTGLDLSVTPPNATNARVSIVVTVALPGATPVIPPTGAISAPFTLDNHRWTLSGSDVFCDGARVGGPVTQVMLVSGRVFAGVDAQGHWFLNAGGGCSSTWTDVGTQTPKEH